jgi:hypothetical protein
MYRREYKKREEDMRTEIKVKWGMIIKTWKSNKDRGRSRVMKESTWIGRKESTVKYNECQSCYQRKERAEEDSLIGIHNEKNFQRFHKKGNSQSKFSKHLYSKTAQCREK